MSDREWILLNPGPANTSREVREALVMPDLCHREPEFFEVMRDCRERLVRLAGGGDGFLPKMRASRPCLMRTSWTRSRAIDSVKRERTPRLTSTRRSVSVNVV